MNRALLTVGFALATTIPAAVTFTDRAEACGGCFVSQSENTQVTGHRMAMSLSPEQTTLYDQITYAGAPEEFAWILPIRGQVDIGLSSDALFATLESITQVTINSPTIQCSPPPSCGLNASDGSGGGFLGAGGGGGEGGGVQIIAAEVVGPYETVQLSSNDPNALLDWLTTKGFVIPEEIEPVIDNYIAEGFDFLALRLVPGVGVDSMRPVRITTPGASAELPLRMVAAGTGAKTVVNLWIIGEGRYEPQNFPSFEIKEDDLVWDWDAEKSNYAELRADAFTESQGSAWHAATAEPTDASSFTQLVDRASYDPAGSGYGDAEGVGAVAEAEADVATLLAGIDQQNLWVSRLDAELSRNALATDLTLEASIPQAAVLRFLNPETTTGTPPECPTFDPCAEDSSGSGGGLAGGGCNAAGATTSPFALAVLCAIGLATARRSRSRTARK